MSVAYGGPPPGGAGYGGGPVPSGRASMEWINEAWRLFSAQAGTWIVSCLVATFLPLVLYFIFSIVLGAGIGLGMASGVSSPSAANGFASGASVGLILFVILFWAAYGLLYLPFIYGGVYHMAVKQVRGELIGIADIFSGGPSTLRMLGYQMIYGLFTFVLTIVLSIPLTLLHVVNLAAFANRSSSFNAGSEIGGILIWYVLLLACFLVVAAISLPAHALIADGEGVFSAISRSLSAMKTQALPVIGLLVIFGLLYMVSAIPCGLGLLVTVPMFWLLSALAYRDMIGMPGLGAPASPYGAPPTPGYTPGVWPPPPSQAPSFGQPPPPSAPPPPSFGQPPASPPRRSLGGEDLDEPGNTPPRPGGTPPQ